MHGSASTPYACTGVLLAGGASMRLGGIPKGVLEVGGRRLIDRTLDALRAATPKQLVVVKDPSTFTFSPGVRVVGDLHPARASLVGLHTALTCAGGAVLALAWDMPFVPGAMLRALRALGERDAVAVVPEGPHGVEPLCAYYPPSALAVVERQLERAELRLGAFVDALRHVTILPLAEVRRFGRPEHLFDNVNSAGDLARAQRRAASFDGYPDSDDPSSVRELQ